jgi:hypothetical protein
VAVLPYFEQPEPDVPIELFASSEERGQPEADRAVPLARRRLPAAAARPGAPRLYLHRGGLVIGKTTGGLLTCALLAGASTAIEHRPNVGARSEEQQIVEVVVRHRLKAGYASSIGDPAGPASRPLYTVCLGLADGRDPSDRLLHRFKPPYRLVRLSECGRHGSHSKDRLLIGPIKWESPKEAEVPWNGLGNEGAYLVRQVGKEWVVAGAVGGFVG